MMASNVKGIMTVEGIGLSNRVAGLNFSLCMCLFMAALNMG